MQRARKIEGLFAVNEKAHVRAHAVLLVDDAKAQAGITLVERGKDFDEGITAGVDFGGVGIREQRRGD